MNIRIKKIIPYFFILLIVGIGFFGSAGEASAQAVDLPTDIGTCLSPLPPGQDGMKEDKNVTRATCAKTGLSPSLNTFNKNTASGTPGAPSTATQITAADVAATKPPQSDFEKYISQNGCGLGIGSNTSLLPGCLISGSYYLFYAIPAGILWLAAYFFNILISVTLSSKLLLAPFVASAWAVVRDLSNLFFILILLYVAIELILGLGSDAKKMIVKVIIVALLINFSMFFTKVIIDSSNILALVFYNKLDVCTNKDPITNQCRHYDTVTGEKDISGSMMDAFDPTRLLTGDFFKTAGTITVPGVGPTSQPVSYQMIILITILAGLVMLFAAYAFFIAGLSFMGRMIELFVLIVFSPFALMSSSIPLLEKVDYIGWKSWLSRLLTVAFMAPIFMFFMYFIFMLVSVKPGIFASLVTQTGDGMLVRIMSVIIPAGLLLILLLKATDFAKKGSGKFGEVLMTGAKMVGGLALGAATGGAAVLGRASVGRMGAVAANSKWMQKWESKGIGGEFFRRKAEAIGAGSFDVRGVKVMGKDLAGATGMNLGKAQEGGFVERRKADVERRQKRAESLKTLEDQPLKQALHKTEADLQDLLNANSKELSELDKKIEKKRQEVLDTKNIYGAGSTQHEQAQADFKNAKVRKKAIATAQDYAGDVDSAGTIIAGTNKDYSGVVAGPDYVDASGTRHKRTIANMEDIELRDRKQEILDEDRKMLRTYANTVEGKWGRAKDFVFSGGQNSYKGTREAAHKIRMGVEVKTKTT